MDGKKSLYFRNGTQALVMECFDGKLSVSIGDEMYSTFEIPKNRKFSVEFDVDWDKTKRKRGYAPPCLILTSALLSKNIFLK